MKIYEDIKRKFLIRQLAEIEAKMKLRMDAAEEAEEEEEEEDDGPHGWGTSLPYGIAKGLGISTKGLLPHEVWDKIEGVTGVTAKEAYAMKEKAGPGVDIKIEPKKEPEKPVPKKKKEYMTKAKLEKKISELDMELEEKKKTFAKKYQESYPDIYLSEEDCYHDLDWFLGGEGYYDPEIAEYVEDVKKVLDEKKIYQEKLDKKLGKKAKKEKSEKEVLEEQLEAVNKEIEDKKKEILEEYDKTITSPFEYTDKTFAAVVHSWDSYSSLGKEYPEVKKAVTEYHVLEDKKKVIEDALAKVTAEEFDPYEALMSASEEFEAEKSKKLEDINKEIEALENELDDKASKYHKSVEESGVTFFTEKEILVDFDNDPGYWKSVHPGIYEAASEYKKVQTEYSEKMAKLLKDKALVETGYLGSLDDEEAKKEAEKKEKIEAFEKEKAEKIKDLTAEKKELSAKKKQLKEELEGMDDDTFEGIWKEPVKTSDYEHLNIAGKKAYYDQKIEWLSNKSDDLTPEEADKLEDFKEKKKLLEVLEENGKLMAEKKKEIADITKEIAKKGKEIKKEKATKFVEYPFDAEAYSEDRKNNAVWGKNSKEVDDLVRAKCGEVWKSSEYAEKKAVYDYTHSPSMFNEELRHAGYSGEGVSFGGYMGSKATTSEAHKKINLATDIIEKSSYDFDMWLQRGVKYSGMDKFFGVPMTMLTTGTQEQLENALLGKECIEHAFMSTATCKGKGFGGDIIMNLYAPAGTKMMYVEPFSYYGASGDKMSWDGESSQSTFSHESEMLIQNGTKFRVAKISRATPYDTIYIDLEVVDQNPKHLD